MKNQNVKDLLNSELQYAFEISNAVLKSSVGVTKRDLGFTSYKYSEKTKRPVGFCRRVAVYIRANASFASCIAFSLVSYLPDQTTSVAGAQ